MKELETLFTDNIKDLTTTAHRLLDIVRRYDNIPELGHMLEPYKKTVIHLFDVIEQLEFDVMRYERQTERDRRNVINTITKALEDL